MQTAIQKAVEDIKGYKTFTSIIDVDFVIAVLNTYVKEEKQQIITAFEAGQKDTANGFYIKNGNNHYTEKYPVNYSKQIS
jgi:hypothetical protein